MARSYVAVESPQPSILRPFRKEDDLRHVADLIAECDDIDQIDNFVSSKAICNDMVRHEANTVVAELEGKIAAVGVVVPVGDERYLAHGYVHPEFRRRGIGRLVAQTNESRSRELAAARGETNAAIHAVAWQSEYGHRLLLFTEGFAKVRTFRQMVLESLDDLPVPSASEFVIRAPAPNEYRRVLIAVDEAFADSSSGAANRLDPKADVLEADVSSKAFDPALCIAAFKGDELAGCLLGALPSAREEDLNRRRVRIDRLGVLPKWRRKGLARQLLHRALHLFRYRNFDSVDLTVDAQGDHGAQKLYESTAFQVVGASTLYQKSFNPPKLPRLLLQTVTMRASWPVPRAPDAR